MNSTRQRFAIVAAILVLAALAAGPATANDQSSGERPPPCRGSLPPTPPAPAPTTIGVVGQAYYCIFDHYVAGSTMDNRTLLQAAFAGFAQELHRRGLDRAEATMPALTGNRDLDWRAVSRVYQRVSATLPADPALHQALAESTLSAMVASLHDNHAQWRRLVIPPGATPQDLYGLGFETSPAAGLAAEAPQETTPPLYVTNVLGGQAAEHGLRSGDIIAEVNGSAPFAGGVLSPGVMGWLYQEYPRQETVRVTLTRPSTGRTWTVTMRPGLFRLDPAAAEPVTVKRLPSNVAYVKLRAFAPGVADQILAAIAKLRTEGRLRGVVLDLRGNGGGSPDEVARLLGAFVHGKVWSYSCDSNHRCTPNKVDDSVALLHLPLAELTDRNCASACDAFSGAMHDHKLGPIIGTRTAGLVSGPGAGYLLADGSMIGLPARHEVSANRELINGIGVAPDHHIPLTAEDLSAGRDPALAKALTLLPN